MSGILCFFHCPANTGYAIARHEYVFAHAAHQLSGTWDKVHFSYTSLGQGLPNGVPNDVKHITKLDFSSTDRTSLQKIYSYIKNNDISIAIGFDQPVYLKSYKYMRLAGVRKFMSYWGAPMSSLNHGLKLLLKQLEVHLINYKPDLFVFQSYGMRKTATDGRGIPFEMTRVVRSGIEVEKYVPDFSLQNRYAHDALNIPYDRKLVIYSGHMEERKGVQVIIEAAIELVQRRHISNVHFVILGDLPGQKEKFLQLYSGTVTEKFITFGGYRCDIHLIQPCCYVALLATTGWDSYPVSTIEVGAAGVPLIVSNLLGVKETVIPGKTGFRFPPGDSVALADQIEHLLEDPSTRERLGRLARKRIEHTFTREQQIQRFVAAIEAIP